MKRLFCLLLAVSLLLCGCGSLQLLPEGGSQTTGESAVSAAQAAEPAQEQVLNVYYERANEAAARALDAYAAAQGVTVNPVGSREEAGLAVLTSAPGEEAAYWELSADPLLAAAGARAGLEGGFTALPLGKTLYGYWADLSVLQAVLGEGFDPAALRTATWKEWESFCAALQSWIETPKAAKVTLGGTVYTLAAAKEGAAAELTEVFAVPEGAYSGTAFSSTLVAADWQLDAGVLTGPLNGLAGCFALEAANSRQPGTGTPGMALDGEAVFYRGRLSDFTAAFSAEQCQNLALVPQKCYFTDDDLATADYNVAGLTNYPVVSVAGRLAIPAEADEQAARAGAGFILWLYTSEAGEQVLTDGLNLVTPWNTASDATALGAMLVDTLATGVVPGVELSDGQNAALDRLAGAMQDPPLNKKAWVAGALEALGAE